jgi:putative tributyrin esterase
MRGPVSGSRTVTSALAACAIFAATAVGCGGAGPTPILAPDAPIGNDGGRFRVLEPPPQAGPGPWPVVYFLHDFFGGDDVLWQHGVADRLTAAMAAGTLPPFLLVAPQGDQGFWADSHDGRRRYEEWLAEGLPRQVAARWPVRPGPAGRALAGISMGGYGALKLALRRPQEVGAAAALSGLVPPLDYDVVGGGSRRHVLLHLALRRTFGRDGRSPAVRRNDLYRLLPGLYDVPPARRPRLLVRAGTDDRYILDEASYLFATVARDNGVEVDLVLEPGTHDWRYWGRTTEEVLAWTVRALETRCVEWEEAGDVPCHPSETAARSGA